ncbi:MAG TPA: ABC transporter ATP-binding protein [Candidatus Binataceae bacterium]|nr:ABC transporter ATP-binding protein [Candidatus Binataceae bacterium]
MSIASEKVLRDASPFRALPPPDKMSSGDIFRLVPRVWPFIRLFRRHLVYLALAVIPLLPGGLFSLALLGVFFDAVGQGNPLNRFQAWMLHVPMTADRHVILWHACVFTGVLTVITIPYAVALLAYGIWILQRMTNQFRVDLYSRLQELSLRFHSEEKIGDAIFRMFQDSAAIPHIINGLIIQPLHIVPVVLVNILVLAAFDYRVAAIAAALIPLELLVAAVFARPLRQAFLAERVATAQATTRIEETLASIKAVKAFGREAAESDLYAHDNWASFVAARRARMMFVLYRVLASTLRSLAYVGAVYFGAMQVLHGGVTGALRAVLSLGAFQGALWVFGGASSRVRNMTQMWGTLQDVGVALTRVFEMMDKLPEERVRTGSVVPPPPACDFAFEQVSFSYDARTEVLIGASFHAKVGEITAIAGPSGSGKSTLIALLLRFFDPTAGRLTLDGQDIRTFKLENYRALISVALQENPLFTATLRDNIVYGRVDGVDEEILHAIARAGLADFTRALPAGLATMLGEKGAKLSTGQAQRIGLARAFLRDAPILILDEPTSALDAATEDLVMRGIREWLDERPRERIVLLATHRRSTAMLADRIYQIAQGRLRESDDSAFDEPRIAEVSNG